MQDVRESPRRVWMVVGGAMVAACAGCGGLARNDNALGVQLYQQGNYAAAADRFQQALSRQPGNPDCFYNLGATYHQQAKLLGRPADMRTAEQYYMLCLAGSPNHAACQRALAVLRVEEGRSADAVAGLRSWAGHDPTNPDPHVELARLAHEHGDLREAENQLIDALARDPNDPRVLVALGRVRELSGESGQALTNYSRALAIDPGQAAAASRVAALSPVPSGQRVAALPTAAAQPGAVSPPVGGAAGATPAASWTPAR